MPRLLASIHMSLLLVSRAEVCIMNSDPKRFNNPAGSQLQRQQTDDVARALLSLTREVCILTDRLAVLETVLTSNGLDVSEAVDTYQPDEALKRKISARTSKIIEDVVASLGGQDYRNS